MQAAKIRWPEVFTSVDAAAEAWVLESMRTVCIHLRNCSHVQLCGLQIVKLVLISNKECGTSVVTLL